MLKIEKFLEYVRDYQIPPSSPIIPNWRDADYGSTYTARAECTKRGMWAIVDMEWTKELDGWIGNYHVLEVMAGKGWLAKALSRHGAKITATDNMGWEKMHSDPTYLYPVEKLGARAAINKYKEADVLLVSWPPYDDPEIVNVCKAWGSKRPIIYIGEWNGGCNAVDKFFEHFRTEKQISIPQWDGIHDGLFIGYYV